VRSPLIVIAVTLSLCLTTPAFADATARNGMDVGATVAKVCRLGNATISGGQNATFNQTDRGGSIALTALADRNTAAALPSSISVTFDGVCNQTLVVRLVSTHGGLSPQNSAVQNGSSFAERVDYTATLDWAGNRTTLSTDGKANESAGVALSGSRAGSVTLTIAIPAGTQPLVSGGYSDVLTVEFNSSL